ncbi:MAG: beta-mannosidase [Phycisphaerae bacterium]
MQSIELSGPWKLQPHDKRATYEATVPGCVHVDLLTSGRIDDPYYRDAELACRWIGEQDWIYSRSFDAPAELLAEDRIELVFEGLDTLATVRLNSQVIGQATNMFRTWRWDITDKLQEGTNRIEITLASPMELIGKRQKARPLPAWGSDQHKVFGGNWVRKMQCNFGWDWGPSLLTCGVWRPVRLEAWSTARLGDLHIIQNHGRKKVGLQITAAVDMPSPSKLAAHVKLLDGEQVVAEQVVPVQRRKAVAELTVKDPQLWWPNGLGDQPLYRLRVELVDEGGDTIDAAERRLGLRTIELIREEDKWGQSFRFAVNGVSIFAKGANWIPAETFPTRVTDDDYRRLLGDAAEIHCNMIRVWGGGIYESDTFYDICDELGILVWQDFMFACATYPSFDADWMDDVAVEAEQNVKRIRHHACLALWCGNNELEQGLVGQKWTDRQMSWADYKKLFDKLLAKIVEKHDPQTAYWPCSPHTPTGDRDNWQSPDAGDTHLWGVWHGGQPFEWYRSRMDRFCSEFGFQSFPHLRTVEGYTDQTDRNVTSYVMEHHQRSRIGNKTILTYMLDWFRMPSSFEQTVWLSQILQGLGMKYAVEHWRRNMPRCMGALYWQLNDCWPVASWSSIDSEGRWKALHYMARHFFAPLIVSGVEDLKTGQVEVHLTSDLRARQDVAVGWQVTDLEGNSLLEGSKECRSRPGGSFRAAAVDCKDLLETHGPRSLLVWLDLCVEGRRIGRDLVTFSRPKHLDLPEPELSCNLVESDQDGQWELMVKTEKPALWVWIDLEGFDARLSDNFFHLPARSGRTIRLTVDEQITAAELKRSIRLRSLRDTY